MTVAEREPLKIKVAVHEAARELLGEPRAAGLRWYASITKPIIGSAHGPTKAAALAFLAQFLGRQGFEHVEFVEI